MGKVMLTLQPRNLSSNWVVNGVSIVDVLLADEANILIKAKDVRINEDRLNNNGNGQKAKVVEEENLKSGVMKVGAGAHTLLINDAQVVSVAKP